jgi:hypothetical protein
MPTPPICLSAYVPNKLKSAIGERHRGGDRDPIADNSLREDKDERIYCPLLTAPLPHSAYGPPAHGNKVGEYSSMGNFSAGNSQLSS